MGSTKLYAVALSISTSAVFFCGCGSDQTCQASSVQPAVYVIDAETLEPLCDAEGEIKEGDYDETITYAGGEDCTGLYALPARSGTYTTFVSSDSGDYAITATQLTIREDSCGSIGPENAGAQNGPPGQPGAVTGPLRKL